MEKQVIVAISREYGSGGHDIGEKIAESFGLHFYDKNILEEIAKEKNLPVEELKKYDESPKRPIESRRVGKFSNSFEDVVAEIQFDYLREKADAGESFVVVGRCGGKKLLDFDCFMSFFIHADLPFRVQRIMESNHLDETGAMAAIRRMDRKRLQYFNRHSGIKWGDAVNYDMTINTSRIGVQQSGELLADYIRRRMEEL